MRWVGGGIGAVMNEQDDDTVVLEGHEIGNKDFGGRKQRLRGTVSLTNSTPYGTLALGPRLDQIPI